MVFSHSLGIQTLWEITLTTLVYIVLLFIFKLIRKEELSRLPIIRKTFIFEINGLTIPYSKPLVFFQINKKLSILKATV